VIKNIIFDFDGVILDSVPTKTEAFRKLFEQFPAEKVEQLIEYHTLNGGISRFVKIKYFFEELLAEKISDEEIKLYADKYSELTKEELTQAKYIIEDVVDFIKVNYKKYDMHIASGADENDLKYICTKLGLTQYFLTINGSPTKKSKIVENILSQNSYNNNETILIGDSLNDYEAAVHNNITFYGYNNKNLMSLTQNQYIESIEKFEKSL